MAKRGLYANINAKKKAGTSRTKSKSTITPEAYANMKAGFPNSKKNKAKAYGGGMMMKKKVKMKTGSTVKPDYLDMDKDGNKKESMKKAIKDKGKMYGGVAKKPKKMYGSTVKKPKKMYGSTVKKPKKMGGGMAHSKKKK